MPGKVGALKSPEVAPRVELGAVDRAFTLVAGWTAKDRNAITAALEDLKATAENNEEVYQQASEALQQLSKERAEVGRLSAEATTRLVDAKTAEKANRDTAEAQARDMASARRELQAEQDAFKQERSRRTSEMDTRKEGLDALQRQVEDQRKKNEAASNALRAREEGVSARERKADDIFTDMRGLMDKFGEG